MTLDYPNPMTKPNQDHSHYRSVGNIYGSASLKYNKSFKQQLDYN